MKPIGNKLFIVLALTLLSTLVVAQQPYAFKVLATSGNAEIKKANTWVPLRSGANLIDSDDVRLGTKSYVGLVHSSGKSKELKSSGVYNVKALANSLGKGTSVVLKYFDFILSKNSDEARQNRLIAVGSVTRTSFKEDILVRLPENRLADMLNHKAIIAWESKADSLGPFVVSIQNLSNEELFSIETADRSVMIDFNRPELKTEFNFLVEVRNKNNRSLKSDQYLIKRLQLEHQQKFNAELAKLSKDMDAESAMSKIMLAGYFETNFLLIDAIAAYEDAIRLAPEVNFYREAYEEFLFRNRLKFPK